jgi:WD40 repeat protein
MVYKNYSMITSLKFNRSNSLLFSGKEDGSLDIIDLHKLKNIRTVKGHLSRIGCIENTEEWGFLSGSKDKIIIHNDIRVKNSTILKVLAHKNEVCGLAFKNNTVASGSNDGRVNIWDLRNKNSFISKKFHQSAAKALQWCPWKLELLASGSGSKDPQIILWNNQDENIEKILNPKNQVTALKWR